MNCEFEYVSQEDVSCVLVYREYDNQTIVVEEYTNNTVFPVALAINDTENCTYAIFGKIGLELDERPTFSKSSPLDALGIIQYVI